MPISIVKRNGVLTTLYSYMTPYEAREKLRDMQYELTFQPESRSIWWRSTDNPKEHSICNKIKSLNHRNGVREAGLSVSEHPHYQKAGGYKYIYPVAGEMVGDGSDGEPVLRNARALDTPSLTPSQKWLDASNHSICPPWFTRDFINQKLVYGTPRPDDVVVLGQGVKADEDRTVTLIFDDAHPRAPKGARGKYQGGRFVPKNSKE